MMGRPRKKWHWPDYLVVDGRKCACVYQDRLELEKEAEDNNRLRNMLYNRIFAKERWFHDGQTFEDFVIPALFWKVVTHNGMAVLHLMGPSNGGKSYLAHAYAHELLGYWLHYRGITGTVYYFFSYAQMLHLMDTFKKGDVVIIDEHSKQLGQDSLAAAVKFDNMLRATRKRGVSYIICDPEEQNVPNCQYMLRTAFYIVENKMTRCMTYTGKTHRMLGLSDWIVPLDEVWFKEMVDTYEQEKDDYLALFTKRGGAADKGLVGKQKRIALELFAHAKRYWVIPGERGWKNELMNMLNDVGYDGETNATREQICDRIIRHLYRVYDKDAKMIDWSIEFDPDEMVEREDWEQEPEKSALMPYLGQTTNLRNAVLNRMIYLGAKSEIIEAFRIMRDAIDDGRYVLEEQFYEWQEMFPDDVIEMDTFRIKRYYGIMNYQGAVKEGWANAFEDVYSAMLDGEGINHLQGGKQTPDPDIVILDDDGQPVEVHSLKTFLNKQGRVHYTYDDIAQSEKDLQVPIVLIVFAMTDNKLYKIPVDDNFIENGVSIKAKSSKLPRGRARTRKERTDNSGHIDNVIKKGIEQTFSNEAQFFEWCKELAKIAGGSALLKALNERGDLKKETIEAIVIQVAKELKEGRP